MKTNQKIHIENWIVIFLSLLTLAKSVQKLFQYNFCDHWIICFILKCFSQILLTLWKIYSGGGGGSDGDGGGDIDGGAVGNVGSVVDVVVVGSSGDLGGGGDGGRIQRHILQKRRNQGLG